MATRLEKVILDVESNLSSVMTSDAAATALLKRELNSLSGNALRASRSIDGIGTSADKSGKQIDRLSGRLVLMAQAAAILGPALVPIGAAGIPAIAGLTAELAAMAGAIAVGVVAFKGLGDGMKALDAYQLEPTAENLENVRLELERLGPAGADFVMFLDSIEPQLKSIQSAARAGLFPGVEDGISSLLTMLPQLRGLTREIAETMGELASDAGDGLAGPKFREFFEYLDTDAAATLESLGRTIGNFSAGFAQMLVEFAPVSRGFTTGLEEMSESFAQWSAGLDQNDSFQSFLAYIQESGPKVLDMLGSMVGAFTSILEAAAPVGDVVVPMLTSLFDIISMLAESPLGPMFFTAAAAMSVYSRAAGLAAAANINLSNSSLLTWRQTKGLGVGIGAVALSLTDFDDKLGVSNTAMLGLAGTMAGPWGAAAGLAVGALLDLKAANSDVTEELEGLKAAMSGSDPARLAEEIAGVRDEMRNASGPTHGLAAAWDDLTGRTDKLSDAADNAEAKLRLLDDAAGRTEGLDHLLGTPLDLAREFDIASDSIDQFSQSFAALNDLLSRSETLIAYEAALDDLTKSVRDNGQAWEAGSAKGRANLEARNRLVETAIDRSEALKKVGDNLGAQKILTRAISDLQRFGDDSPKAQAKVRELIAELRRLDGTEAKPKADVDNNPAKRKVDETNSWLINLNKKRSESEVDADASGAFETFYKVAAYKIPDKTVIVRGVNGGGFGPQSDFASGGYTGHGRKYEVAGIVHRGEVVIPQERVKADWSMLKARYGDLPGMASGGLAGANMSQFSGDANLARLALAAEQVTYGFNRMSEAGRKELEQRQRLLEKEVDRDKRRLDMLKQEQEAIAAAVSSAFSIDVFGGGGTWTAEELMDKGLSADQAAAHMQAQQMGALSAGIADKKEALRLLGILRDRGLNGPAFVNLAATGDVATLRAYAEMSKAELRNYEQQTNQDQRLEQRIGGLAGNAEMGGAIREQTKELRESKAELRQINHRVREVEKAIEKASKNEISAMGNVVGSAARRR